MADTAIKSRDNKILIDDTLEWPDKPSLDGATVLFVLKAVPAFEKAATIVNAANRQVRVELAGAEVPAVGSYDFEWDASWPDGTRKVFPTHGYHKLAVNQALKT